MEKKSIEHQFYKKDYTKNPKSSLKSDDETLKINKKGATKEALSKRARRMFSNLFITKHLTALHQEQDNHESSYWIKRYNKTMNCSKDLQTYDGELFSAVKLCKERFCLVCSSIRTAQLINGYKDEIARLNDKYLVTLTIRNVEAKDLASKVREMLEQFRLCKDNIRKTHKVKLVGTRNLEVSFNPKYLKADCKPELYKKCYHPHFHCIIEGKDEAELLLDEWRKKYPDETSIKAQNIRKFGSTEKDLLECFKYVNKILSEDNEEVEFIPEVDEFGFRPLGKFKMKIPAKIYIQALDVIIRATSGIKRDKKVEGAVRVFQAFGNLKKKTDEELDEVEVSDEQVLEVERDNAEYFEYDGEYSFDWLGSKNGKLTEFVPSKNLQTRVETIVHRHEEQIHETNLDDYKGEEKEKDLDKIAYEKEIKKYRGSCEIYNIPYRDIPEMILEAYKTICEAENAKIFPLTIVEKIKGKKKAVGAYYFDGEKRIEIVQNNKSWLVTLIHEFTHQMQDNVFNSANRVRWHTSEFRHLNLNYLKKYFMKIVEKIKNE